MRTIFCKIRMLIAVLLITGLFGASVFSQQVDLTEETYVRPNDTIADLVSAPRHLNVTLDNLSPDKTHFLVTRGAGLAKLKDFARPFVNLGEMEFDFKANRSRWFVLNKNIGFGLFNYKTGETKEISAPKGGWVTTPVWSPDGSKIAYYVHFDKETFIYVTDVGTGKSKKITRKAVLPTVSTERVRTPQGRVMLSMIKWTPDSKQIMTVLIPDDRAPMPEKEPVPSELEVRITGEGENPTPTFRFLLKTPHDRRLLEWLATGQLALIDVDSRKTAKLSEPAMFRNAEFSPDGKHIRAVIFEKPFSYIVPVRNFGTVDVIYDLAGNRIAEVNRTIMKEKYDLFGYRGDSDDEDDTEKRDLVWRPDGKGLSFLQKEPKKNGDDNGDNERKDRVMMWAPPFDTSEPVVVFESENKINSINYSQDCGTLFIIENKNGKRHLYAVYPDQPDKKYTIYKFKSEDIYSDPGDLLTRNGDNGGIAVRMPVSGDYVYLNGTKFSKDPMNVPPIPFVYKINIKTGEKTALFESSDDVYEELLTAADDDLNIIFTSRETPADVPDSYVRNLSDGLLQKLTSNKDYTKAVTGMKRLRFQVERIDGFKFWVRVILPADYKEGTSLPAMFWFYPSEFKDQEDYNYDADEYNKNAYPSTRTRSMEFLATQGYAVVFPDCPIVGPREKWNNNYVPHLRNSLWAVIDLLDSRNYIDRNRMGIGGHSYGAFGTANAMIHTPFFKAGIAGDGNYNRTLTPMTFQREGRTLQEAREVYVNMSPLFWANQLNGALLMYHGADDPNNGTFPINSVRMFHVLNSLGKTASMYMYPYEHHGPAAEETLLDLWARWVEWLDKYVKNADVN